MGTVLWPEIDLIGPRSIRLRADFSYTWKVDGFPEQKLVVPSGFICDGASVPKILHWYLGWDEILIAAIPHDWLYAFGGAVPETSHFYVTVEGWVPTKHVWTRRDSDRLFSRMLRYCDVPGHARRNSFRAVRLFGRGAWRKQTWRPESE